MPLSSPCCKDDDYLTPTMDDDIDLRMIVRRHTPRDSDPNYTKFFAEQFFQALLRADRVTLSDSAAGKVRAFWVDADGGKLLDLQLPSAAGSALCTRLGIVEGGAWRQCGLRRRPPDRLPPTTQKHKTTLGNLFPSASIPACELTRQRFRRNSQMPPDQLRSARGICDF